MQESVQEVTSEATQEVNRIVQFFEDHIPDLVAFGIQVLLALVFFFVGSKPFVDKLLLYIVEHDSGAGFSECFRDSKADAV